MGFNLTAFVFVLIIIVTGITVGLCVFIIRMHTWLPLRIACGVLAALIFAGTVGVLSA